MDKILWIYDTAIGEYQGKDVIWIWSLDDDGNYYLLIDDRFKDYFYIDSSKLSLDNLKNILRNSLRDKFKDIEFENVIKLLFGKEKNFIKLSGTFSSIKEASDVLSSKYGRNILFENDLRPSQKYIMDKSISPTKWYKIEYDEVEEESGVSIGLVKDIAEADVGKEYPRLKIVSIDMILGSKYGAPDSDIDPILGYILYDGKDFHEYYIEGNDSKLIDNLEDEINRLDPHVIVGFETNSILWPYLNDRSKKYKKVPKIGKLGGELHQSVLGHFSIGGRINIDLKEYVNDIPIFQRKTLEELSEYLKLKLFKYPVDRLLYYQYWSNDREKLLNYIRWRVKTIYESYKLLEDHIYALSETTYIPPDYVLTASSGRRAEYFIMKVARSRNEVVPNIRERVYRTYPGGLVLKPKRGLHSNIAVIDYKSMYPTLMIKYNVSPETIVSEPGGDTTFFEEIGYGVRRDRKGLLPTILEELTKKRDEIKSVLKKLDHTSRLYKILDARQRVLKILSNTMYGYMGWMGARWYSYEGASIVTYLGRRTIGLSIDKAKEIGLDIIYGDTDSIFINYDEDKVNILLNWMEKDLGLEAKIDKIFKKILFTEAKKRYAGLTTDGDIEVVGLEYVRRDWCEYARDAQYNILKHLLEGYPKNKLLDIFREYVKKLRRKEVSINKLIIWEQITKSLDEYKVNAPHVEVARKLSSEGWRVKRGVFIGYVIYKGEGPLYKRAIHYTKAEPKYIDWEYYIFNQLLPVAIRILSPIGISDKTLESIAHGAGMGLDMFV